MPLTVNDIRAMSKPTILASEAAQVLGCDPQWIRLMARERPEKLGFPVCCTSKAPDASTIEDEIAALGADAVAEKGKTVFPRTDGQPILYDYQIKGFFKDACGMLARVKSKKSSALKAYKKIIDRRMQHGGSEDLHPDAGCAGAA